MARRTLQWIHGSAFNRSPYDERVTDGIAQHHGLTYEVWHYREEKGRYFVAACDLPHLTQVWDATEVKTLRAAKHLAAVHAGLSSPAEIRSDG